MRGDWIIPSALLHFSCEACRDTSLGVKLWERCFFEGNLGAAPSLLVGLQEGLWGCIVLYLFYKFIKNSSKKFLDVFYLKAGEMFPTGLTILLPGCDGGIGEGWGYLLA